VGPCQHDIARPQVADGGDGLQIWRVAANSRQMLELGGGGGVEWGTIKSSP
jgi:hypothetical protein